MTIEASVSCVGSSGTTWSPPDVVTDSDGRGTVARELDSEGYDSMANGEKAVVE